MTTDAHRLFSASVGRTRLGDSATSQLIGRHAVLVSSRDPRSRADHGRITVLRTALAALADGFERVSVFHLRPETTPVEDLAPNASFDHLESTRPTRLGHAVRAGVFGHHSLNEVAGIDRTQIAGMVEALGQSGVDLFVLDGTRAAAALPALGAAPSLVDLDDLLSTRYRAWADLPFDEMPYSIFGTKPASRANVVARIMRPLLPAVLRQEARAVATIERDVASRATAVSLVSAKEAAQFSAQVSRPVDVLPMAAPSAPLTCWSSPSSPRFDAVFLGRVTHMSNMAALNWLGRKVLPALTHGLGRAPRIGIAGASTPAVDSWLRSLGLEPLGFVDDLEALFASAATALAPQVAGGGLNTKVLDYAIHGVPVVGSSHAFAGLLHSEECPFDQADDPVAFADAVARLGSDPQHARESGRAGREHIEAYYRPTDIKARWTATFAAVIDHSERPNGSR